METRSFCGTLLLELVEGEVDDAKAAVVALEAIGLVFGFTVVAGGLPSGFHKAFRKCSYFGGLLIGLSNDLSSDFKPD